MRFGRHLEETLGDLNDRVAVAEVKGSDQELLELLINRGTVLKMFDSTVSAVSDFEDAVAIIDAIEEDGGRVDAGIFVKVYVSLGELFVGDGVGDSTAEYYAKAAERLDELRDGSRYFDSKGVVEMCVMCANDLLDASKPAGSVPFLHKALEILGDDRRDTWSRNKTLVVRNSVGRALMDMGNDDGALEAFADAREMGTALLGEGLLEDGFEIIFPLIYAGDLKEAHGDLEGFVECHKSAIEIMENVAGSFAKIDPELLSDLHRGVAMALMKLGRTGEAERHLLRTIALDLPAMDRAMDNLGIRR